MNQPDWTDFAAALPREERLVFQFLHHLILEVEPRLVEKVNYGVPYFSRHKRVCFIWPVSAPNAPTAKNQTWHNTIVSLGFCYGNLLSNHQNLLLSEGRKQVYIVRLKSLAQAKSLEQEIREIVLESVLLDESMDRAIRKKYNCKTRKK